MKRFFVTGIGTGVGKTVVSAILTEALKGDYWKPIQCGNLEDSDSMQVRDWVSNPSSVFHLERYRLKEPAAPNRAAALENVEMKVADFNLPETENTLIIEGAGGLMVPINDRELMTDLIIHLEAPVVVVSHNYLGSINHTLLTIEHLRLRRIAIAGVVFNGKPNPASEEAIVHYGNIKTLGRVKEESKITNEIISQYADVFRDEMLKLSNRDELI